MHLESEARSFRNKFSCVLWKGGRQIAWNKPGEITIDPAPVVRFQMFELPWIPEKDQAVVNDFFVSRHHHRRAEPDILLKRGIDFVILIREDTRFGNMKR